MGTAALGGSSSLGVDATRRPEPVHPDPRASPLETAATGHVDVLVLTSMDAESLGLLPVDVRDALERTLLTMPD